MCLVVRHSSPLGLFLGRRTSFFYLSYSRWSGICSLASFLEKLAFCLFRATSLLSTLYSMQRRASFLLSCRDHQFKPWSMSLTLDLFQCLLVTYCAARRCTISSFWMFLWVCGSHTVLAYYTRGLTRVKYDCCLVATEAIFLRRKPKNLRSPRVVQISVR